MRKSYDLFSLAGWVNLFGDLRFKLRTPRYTIYWGLVLPDTFGRFVCLVYGHKYVTDLSGHSFLCSRCTKPMPRTLSAREKAMRARLVALATWARRHSSELDAINMAYFADNALSEFPDPDAKVYGRRQKSL